MSLSDWSELTPENVSTLMTFVENDEQWEYDSTNRTSMAAKQAEGVAYLCQLLKRQGLALLADEVGMGKTFQALGVVKLVQQVKPDAKVLIIGPNKNICHQWIGEVKNFEQNHWKENISVAEDKTDLSIAGPFSKLEELVQKLIDDDNEEEQKNLYFTTIHALSRLISELDNPELKLQLVAKRASELKDKVLHCLGTGGFDLLIIDEAHYLRTRHGGSQKVEAAKHFFGQDSSPIASKVLLMTATPTHSSAQDVENILRYFTTKEALQGSDNKSKDASMLLEQFGLRRLRLLQGRDNVYAKQNYRREIALPVSFEGSPNAELFFGLYQRQLVRGLQKKGSNKQFLYGYLEGFESFGEQDGVDLTPESDDHDDSKTAFRKAPDSKLLYDLSQEYHGHFETYPQHPKYKALVDEFVPNIMYPSSLDECKHLVFVRRIPSVRELTKRVNSRYDDLFGNQIADVLDMNREQIESWKLTNWSRSWLNKWSENNGHNETSDEEPDDITQVDEDVNASRVSSRITELFVVKKKGTGSTEETRNTICTNVGLRFKKSESIFSLFLEPALNYYDMDYQYYLEQKSGGKTRAIYSSAAQFARNQRLSNASKTMEGKTCEATVPIPTIWKHLLEHLAPEHKQILDKWNEKIKENFANYFKAGVLFASPVMIELFGWFMIFSKNDKLNSSDDRVLRRYNDFIIYSSQQLKDSNLLWYFKSALITFEDVCNKIARIKVDDYQHDWRKLKIQSSPAAYASGESSNRENLQLGFNSPFYPNVLVATSVFQEGVNLHLQCNNIHHYGIAGSPGDHEQRVGRLDRLFSKVNRQLKSEEQGQLNINFPYLESSFDEDQLASFLEKKTLAENKLDRCLLNTLDSFVGTQKVQNWTQYLKQPEHQTGMISDPYPAQFKSRGNNE
ncbi:MAG TPA: hypothetical protein DEV85_01005 [Vibrio sp.]|uniref:DEAD/DEAH box helicase n=1 Tax=Vibrio sp. TaxID=678 RepID=UPI000EE52166|nr:DEAD/DEAH box helicase [Vibrio sp.]HCH00456.1 hypothetical protein [Vibrio sp.]